MNSFRLYLAAFSFIVLCSACGGDEEKKEVKPKTFTKISDTTSFSNNLSIFNNKAEVVGIFDVPEMLVMSIMDSSNVHNVGKKMAADLDELEKEIQETGAEVNGPSGTISYTNRVNSYWFEVIVCIKKIPTKQPKRAKIVILESSPMIIFNFYGSYQNLFSAYNKLKKYCEENNLKQTGPMREFYLSDPNVEKDPNLWQTRIMLPVTKNDKPEEEAQ